MKNEGESTGRYLSATLRDLVLIIGVYLYFIGWTYSYYLLKHFGISLSSLDIQFYYFFVYSYAVIMNLTMLIIWAVAMGASLLFMKVYFKKWVFAIIIVGFFIASFNQAKVRGDKEGRTIRSGAAKPITFVLKKELKKFYPRQFINANDKRRLRILAQARDRFYVFYQPAGEGEEIPYGFVYDVPRSDILLATVEMQNISKKEDRK